MLIDAQPPDRSLVGVGDRLGGGSEHRGHQPPRHPVGAGHLAGRPAGDHDGCDQRSSQPGGRPGVGRHLIGDLAERPSRAAGLVAEPAALGPHQLHRPADRQIPQPLPTTGVHPPGQYAADRTAGWIGGLDLDPTDPVGVLYGVDDPVVGQVEDRARSITLRARRLEHGSWTSLVRMSRQHPSQQDHEPSTSPGRAHDHRLTPRPPPGTAKSQIAELERNLRDAKAKFRSKPAEAAPAPKAEPSSQRGNQAVIRA